MKLKKIIILLIVGIMFSTTYAMPTNMENIKNNIMDVLNNWSKEAVLEAIEEEILIPENRKNNLWCVRLAK